MLDENPTAEEHGLPHLSPTSFVGRVFGGRWTIVRWLGSGGTASVYEAVHRNGRRVAVKILHRELANNPPVRRRFQFEGYAANRVPHPNVVAVLDDGEEPDGSVYLVMELLEGRSLAARLEESDSSLAPEVVVAVAMAVLDVLAVAHEHGVVHRDIKPANIFETLDRQIKLLDFGAARVALSAHSSVVTESGKTVGTPAFMAPEQAAGQLEEVDALSDIWAVGATMFQLLSGRLVHSPAGDGALMAAATMPAPGLRSVVADISPAVAQVVDRALAFLPAQRWPNARAMRRALEQVSVGAEARSLEASPLDPHTGMAPRHVARRRTIVHWVNFLALVVSCAGSVAVFAHWYFSKQIPRAVVQNMAQVEATTRAADVIRLGTDQPLAAPGGPTLPASPEVTPRRLAPGLPDAAPGPVSPRVESAAGASKRSRLSHANRSASSPSALDEALLNRRK